jgi:hypothetical protein
MKTLFLKPSDVRPTYPEKPIPSLAACLLMDLLGYASYGIPILGELSDLAWAPISALIYLKMFGFKKGLFGGVFNFVEEILPGLDFIPTFTITWCVYYFRRKKESFGLETIRKNFNVFPLIIQ